MVNWPAAPWLGWGVLIGFLLDWSAIAMDWRRIKPVTKPLAIVILMIWTAVSAGVGITLPLGLLLAAQAFGLIGDILLLLPEKAFFAGLSSFFVGHLLYLGLLVYKIFRLFDRGELFTQHLGGVLVGLMLWSVLLILIYRLLKPLPGPGGISRRLWVAIQTYAWILSSLVALTWLIALRSSSPLSARLALPFGALLFLISDGLLSYNRFIRAFAHAQLWVRITYHLAQFSLAWGFLNLIV